MKKLDMSNLTRKASMFGLKCKKHSPEILTVAGVVTFGATIFTACKATRNLDEVLDKATERIDKCHKIKEGELVLPEGEEWTEQEYTKNVASVYINTGFELGKLYAPAIAFGTASLVCFLGANHILRKRNAALGAALATTTTLFKDYRGRVVERFGERTDFELRHNIKAEEIDRVVVNEDGSEQVVKEVVDVKQSQIDVYTEFARCFDESNPYYKKSAEYNKSFLLCREAEANKRLQHRGYMFLNEVYEMLGFPTIEQGHMVGWIYDKDNPIGDNQISFGMFDADKPVNHDFVNGYEKSIWLDFNVDGEIYKLVW